MYTDAVAHNFWPCWPRVYGIRYHCTKFGRDLINHFCKKDREDRQISNVKFLGSFRYLIKQRQEIASHSGSRSIDICIAFFNMNCRFSKQTRNYSLQASWMFKIYLNEHCIVHSALFSFFLQFLQKRNCTQSALFHF